MDNHLQEMKKINDHLKSLDNLNKNFVIAFESLISRLDDNSGGAVDVRPCYISKKTFKNGPKKAIFHRWIELKTPNLTQTLALVEYEDGTVEQIKPTNVVFVDSSRFFEEYAWPEEENNEEEEDSEQQAQG